MKKRPAIAIIRIDYYEEGTDVTVRGVYIDNEETVAKEVQRLNRLNKDKGCYYYLTPTRIYGPLSHEKVPIHPEGNPPQR